jgi:uncharacterized membrane protein YebE (DUF533 family)
MDLQRLLGHVLSGALGSRPKRSRKTRGWLGSSGSPLRSAGTLLALGGAAWALYETWQREQQQKPTAPQAPPAEVEPVLRYLRLAIAAARADGEISGKEREHLLAEARQAGLETVALRELESPRPLREIVSEVNDPAQRRDLYKLAFAIVRADEGVSDAERLWLGQLTLLLGIEPLEAARLERDVASGIDGATTA